MEYITLTNGVKMPKLGYGVFQIDNDETERCVSDAIKSGYRLIDTAQAYLNEEGVGNAIVKSGIDRSEFFITTKVWISNAGYEAATESLEESMKKLKTDYVDLVLIHQPFNDYYGTWRAMSEMYKQGKIKAIGVSNFEADRLVDLCSYAEIKPMINQLETHVFQQQHHNRTVMNKYDVATEAWGPFAEGKNGLFTNETLVTIGQKYNKTAAQVALRFLLDKDIVAIPKSSNIERMKQNFDIFDFKLDEEDIKAIEQLDEGKTLFIDKRDYEVVERFAQFKI